MPVAPVVPEPDGALEPDEDPLVVPMFGQWRVVVLPLLEDPLDPLDPLDDDVVVDDPVEVVVVDDPVEVVVLAVLAVVAAWVEDGASPLLAPATSMLAPRPSPSVPATTPAATIG